MQNELQALIYGLNKMIRGAQPPKMPLNDYQCGFRDALVIVRNDARNLVTAKPAPASEGVIRADTRARYKGALAS